MRRDAVAAQARGAGLLIVLLLHAGVLYLLVSYRLLPAPPVVSTLFVDLIAPPPPPPKVEPPKPPPPRKRVEPRQPRRQIVATAPVVAPNEPVAPPPPKVDLPVVADAPPPPPKPRAEGPLRLGSELALSCPERRAPAYPSVSRRTGETGQVVLRVELSEAGLVARAQVEKSSGHVRLDDAALAAVKTWKCHPPQREGRPVRAIALQPFNFVLEGV